MEGRPFAPAQRFVPGTGPSEGGFQRFWLASLGYTNPECLVGKQVKAQAGTGLHKSQELVLPSPQRMMTQIPRTEAETALQAWVVSVAVNTGSTHGPRSR